MRTDVHDSSDVQAASVTGSAIYALGKYRAPAIALGVLGILGLIVGFVVDKQAFFTSYFFAFIFWMGLTLGCTTLTYLHHTVRGTWGLAILRVLEAGNKTLPLMGMFFIPILLGMLTGQIYPWTDPVAVAHSEPMRHRYAAWMNPTGFTVRALIYFTFWIVTTQILNRNTARQDKTGDPELGQWRQSFAPPAGVLHVVLVTFAYTDWLMSLDPVWYSTIYGVIFLFGGILSAMCFGTLIVTSLADRRPYSEAVTPALTRNMGNMILGFTMFWAYTNLSQFLIQWSGNLPEEITYYANRFSGGLVFVGAIIVIFQFFAPFLMLLSGRTKRTFSVLKSVSILILVMRAIDVWWQVTPFFRAGSGPQYLLNYALDIGAFVGIGGCWLWLFLSNLRQNTLLPEHDLRLQEAKANTHA